MPVRSVLSMLDRSLPNTPSLLYALLPPGAAVGAFLSLTEPTAPLMRLTASANFCSWITICSSIHITCNQRQGLHLSARA